MAQRGSPARQAGAWWRHAVIYQIYIRSFADGNGDGVGDVAGIRSRLGYLRDLGVDAIWVTPWYPSPMADGGYDVADYRSIHPALGTLGEVEALIQEAHDHGLRLIVDIVPNHTSDQHPWFQAALAAAPGSPERSRFHFRRGAAGGQEPPNDWGSVFGGRAWSPAGDGSGEWYLHLFAPEQPDLNWEHPEVRAEFVDIIRFWASRGVDGFRIDVASGLLKDPAFPNLGHGGGGLIEPPDQVDHPYWDREGVHEIYRSWRRTLDEFAPERVFVAETWPDDPARLASYLRPDELHTGFNFDYLRCPWDPERLRATIDSSIATTAAVGAPPTWVLSNHDVIRHVTRYGRERTDSIHAQPGPPPPTDLDLGARRARAALLLMLALPGSAYVYQGEELGLWEVEDLPEAALQDPTWRRSGHTIRGRDGCRVPLPWAGESPPFGFGDGAAPWLPQPAAWKGLTAEAQAGDPGSMLALYRTALRRRRDHPALGEGPLRWLDAPPGVLLLARDPGLLCAVNFSGAPVPLPANAGVILASAPLDGDRLPPDGAAWLVAPAADGEAAAEPR